MSEQTNSCIIGYSGHAYVVLEAAVQSGLKVQFYSEKNEAELNPYQLNYLGFESDEHFKGQSLSLSFILGIGDNLLRRKAAEKMLLLKREILNVIHPRASVSYTASVGTGTFVSAGATVNALARIGKFCILNTACIIEHECVIGDAVHVSPGAVLAGNVRVGENTFIGANSVVKQGVVIGNNVIIGAGSVVISDIEDGATYAGNPAKRIK